MGLFRRVRDTEMSLIRREGFSGVIDPATVPLAPTSPLAPVLDPTSQLPPAKILPNELSLLNVRCSPSSHDGLEDSDVFVCNHEHEADATRPAVRAVTLFVHGWHNAAPGLLSWTFPSLSSALDAVQRMKNAVGWCVVSGTGWTDLDAARAGGAVLVEQLS